MFFQVPVYLSLILVLVHGRNLDTGPQTFAKTNSSTPIHTHKGFAIKDVVVYLTPSQIKDLESGKTELRYTAPDQITINKLSNIPRTPYQNPQESYHRHRENLNILKAPLIPEPQTQSNYGKQEEKLIKEPADKYPQRWSNLRVLQLGPLNLIKEQVTDWRPVTPVVENDTPLSQEKFNENWQKVLQKNSEQLKQIFHYGSSPDPTQLSLDAQNQQYLQTKPIAQTENFDSLRIPNVQKTQDQFALRQSFPAPAALPYEISISRLHSVPVENIKNIEQLPTAKEPTQNNKHSFIKNIFINVDSPYLHA